MSISPEIQYLLECPEREFESIVAVALCNTRGGPFRNGVERHRRNLIGPVVFRVEIGAHIVEVCRSDERRGKHGIVVMAVDGDLEGHSRKRTSANTLPLEALASPNSLMDAIGVIASSRGEYAEKLNLHTTTTTYEDDGFRIELRRFAGWEVRIDGDGRRTAEKFDPIDQIVVKHAPDLDHDAVQDLNLLVTNLVERPVRELPSTGPVEALAEGYEIATLPDLPERAKGVVIGLSPAVSASRARLMKQWLDRSLPSTEYSPR